MKNATAKNVTYQTLANDLWKTIVVFDNGVVTQEGSYEAKQAVLAGAKIVEVYKPKH